MDKSNILTLFIFFLLGILYVRVVKLIYKHVKMGINILVHVPIP